MMVVDSCTEKISVIVPVYNSGKYLDRCIRSILRQTYRNIELIIVDDGSTDESAVICDNYCLNDSRVRVIHQDNSGVSFARNRGICVATGDLIGFVDSDDFIEPQMYEVMYMALISTGSEIVQCMISGDKKNRLKKRSHDKIRAYSQSEYARSFFKIGDQQCRYYPWDKLYRRSVISEDQFPEGISVGEDVVSTFKAILKSRKITEISDRLYHYSINQNSVSASFSVKDLDLIKVWDMIVTMSDGFSEYKEWAQINRDRINATLLYRYACAYRVSELKESRNVDGLLTSLRCKEKKLLGSGIARSRKIFIWLFCRNYYLLAFFIHLIKT